jgi:uncharacterized membrane protein
MKTIVKMIVIAILVYVFLVGCAAIFMDDSYWSYFRGICFGMFASIILRDCGEYLRQPKEKRKNDSEQELSQ